MPWCVAPSSPFRPDPSIKKNAIENEALKAAFEFEQSIKQGYVVDDRQTFEQYAAYVLELKERTGLKHSTIESYKDLLKRINPSIGFMKLHLLRENIILVMHLVMVDYFVILKLR